MEPRKKGLVVEPAGTGLPVFCFQARGYQILGELQEERELGKDGASSQKAREPYGSGLGGPQDLSVLRSSCLTPKKQLRYSRGVRPREP